MLTVQNIQDAFENYKSDISDVSSTIFVQWVQFTAQYIYDKVKRVDPERFVKNQLYSVVLPPQTEALPTDFMDLKQTACGLYVYATRKRKVVSFDSTGDTDVTYADTGGTSVYNTDTYVEGDASRGYTGDAAASLLLSWGTVIDWTDFDDAGASSPTNDYVSVWCYIGNTSPLSVTVEFSSLNTGASVGVNQFSYTDSSLTAGWNNIKAAKSGFTTTGSPAWSSLGYLRLTHAGGDATSNVYWDKLELIESETNGKNETDTKIGVTGYGSSKEGYYLNGSNVVFTGGKQVVNNDYMMRYVPKPPVIDALTDYLTVDGTASTAKLVEDHHLQHLVKAIDVLYEQWDKNPSDESQADFRFVRALGEILDTINRTPQISQMDNPANDF